MDAMDYKIIGKAVRDGKNAAQRMDKIDHTGAREVGECVEHELALAGYRIVKEPIDKNE
jgi:hypothetical protein